MSYPGELACMPFLNKPHPQYVIVGVSKGGGGGTSITAYIWGGFSQTSTFFVVIFLIITR